MDDSIAQNDQSKMGVYYRNTDYAGLVRRMIIVVIDTFVIFLGMLCINVYWFVFVSSSTTAPSSSLLIWLAISYLYLAILKPTRLRTLGYILTDVEIVDLKGKRPSWLTMTHRFISLILGPVHLIVDLLWLIGEQEKQTLRDKMAGTYVIRRNAQPIGTGTLTIVIYHILGFVLSFRELRRNV